MPPSWLGGHYMHSTCPTTSDLKRRDNNILWSRSYCGLNLVVYYSEHSFKSIQFVVVSFELEQPSGHLMPIKKTNTIQAESHASRHVEHNVLTTVSYD